MVQETTYEEIEREEYEENDLFSEVNRKYSEFQTRVDLLVDRVDKSSEIVLFDGLYSFDDVEVKLGSVYVRDETDMLMGLTNFLSNTNYDSFSLVGERVILFKNPIYVQNVYLKVDRSLSAVQRKSLNKKSLSLISYKNTEKEYRPITLKTQMRRDGVNFSCTSNVSELIYGIIFPQGVTPNFLYAVNFLKSISEQAKILKISESFIELQDSLTNYQADFENFKKSRLGEISALKNQSIELNSNIDNLNAQRIQITDSIKSNEKMAETISSDVKKFRDNLGSLEQEYDALIESKASIQEDINKKNGELKLAKNKLDLLEGELRAKKDEVEKETVSLKAIVDNKNIRSLDNEGFAAESRSQNFWYLLFSFFTLSFLACVFSVIYTNATDYMALIDSGKLTDPITVLISRLPLIAATFLIVGSLSAILVFMLKIVVSLNQQKMNMLKASILVRQINPETFESIGASPDEIRDLKIKAKIDILERIFPQAQESKIKNNDAVEIIKELKGLIEKLGKG